MAPTGSSRALRLGIAAGVLAVFLGLGVFLLILCFRSDPQSGEGSGQVGGGPGSGPAPIDPAELKRRQEELKRRQRIQASIERGVAYLKGKFDRDDFRTPYTIYPHGDTGVGALAGLTMLECGVAKNDPVIVRVANRVRKDGPVMQRTYSLSLSILFLDRLEDKADEGLIRDMCLTLVAGQTTAGGWSYMCPRLTPADRDALMLALRGQGAVPVAALPKTGGETNSNTQFAVLGLWMARKHKLPVEQALQRVADRFRSQQAGDGSWGYTTGRHIFRDSMTCAGLLAVGVGRGLDKTPEKGAGGKTSDPAIEKGLRFLTASLQRLKPTEKQTREDRIRESQRLDELTAKWPAVTNEERQEIFKRIPGQLAWRGALVDAEAMGDLYFLWSIERVAVLYDLKTFGEFDWYTWGSEMLLSNQQPDGGWRERIPGIPDTCFALLFLRRANLIKDLTDRLQGSLGLAADLGKRNDRKTP
jgi:hypothetical protein